MRFRISSLIALLLGFLTVSIQAGLSDDSNPIIELQSVLAPGQTCTLHPTTALTIFDTRAAKRSLDKLLPNKPITILAVDRFGFKVRGTGSNGLLTGWVGRKSALANDAAKLAAMDALYNRQITVEQMIAAKRPAIGMSLREIARILGTATSHSIVAEDSTRTETAVWVINEKVDLNDTLELGTDSPLLRVEVETGRTTVGFVDGVARSIQLHHKGIAADIPTVPNPIKPPFTLATTSQP